MLLIFVVVISLNDAKSVKVTMFLCVWPKTMPHKIYHTNKSCILQFLSVLMFYLIVQNECCCAVVHKWPSEIKLCLETSEYFYIFQQSICLCLKDKGHMNGLPVYMNANGNINCKCFND